MAPVYTWLGGGGGTGDEPGVDVKSRKDEDAWGHLTGKTSITVRAFSSRGGSEDSWADIARLSTIPLTRKGRISEWTLKERD